MELLIVLIIIAAVIGLYKPIIKGRIGEKTVSLILSRLDETKYKVIDDVMLKMEERTSQIDHVIVSNYGVFVIETKNYKGWIFGDEHNQYWTQQIYKRKEKLYNPIHQNYGHVKALKYHLNDYKGVKYIPIVVFSTKADLKIRVTSEVVYTMNLLKAIRRYCEEVISDDQKEDIYSKILSLNMRSKEERRNHIANIHHNKNVRVEKLSNDMCPKCGGKLIIRKGKYGEFKGCSNYPGCNFTVRC